MKTKVQAVNFEISEKLQEFVEKRVGKLERFYADILDAVVALTVEKREQANNKKARITLSVKGSDLFSEKQADSFEEAVVEACEALERQLEKYKEKK
ncbi:MAG: ribosome-associated translation inhibitor RaiA [Porphyromonas sp.]|nr:ribosome-associated translation inhibitor RaiA [Porphyromonas sp.]